MQYPREAKARVLKDACCKFSSISDAPRKFATNVRIRIARIAV